MQCIFLRDKGRRPVYGGTEKFHTDPHWKDHLLFHEYSKDANALQGTILLRMKPDGCGLTLVGDDAQSIYSFRAARTAR